MRTKVKATTGTFVALYIQWRIRMRSEVAAFE